MSLKTLVDTATLAAHVGDPLWAIVDCRFMLADPGWGGREYLAQHIPGAVYAHIDRALSGKLTGTNGRHPLPEPATLARTLGEFGIASGVQVVAYDQDNAMFASRLWWLLRWMGHDDVAVLDGGFAKWTRDGRPAVSANETRPHRLFGGHPRGAMTASVDEVARISAGGRGRLIDVRAPERYRGEIEPVDRVPGHIPGAVNDPFLQNVDEEGKFREAGTLSARLSEAMGGATPDEAVYYCGSGVTACQSLLALEVAGLPGARLYPGSWSEWSSDPSRPIETGSSGGMKKGPAM